MPESTVEAEQAEQPEAVAEPSVEPETEVSAETETPSILANPLPHLKTDSKLYIIGIRKKELSITGNLTRRERRT